MYEYRIAVPADHADEIENILRNEAKVQREGSMPVPDEMASEESWAIQAGTPLAILRVKSTTLQSIESLKNWLEQRFGDPYVDIRAQEPSGAFHFSFQAHSAEDIKDWVENQA
jgi:hypothetical protein